MANCYINILSLITGFVAVIISWLHNKNEPLPLRILYAFFAYWFGILYLIYYWIEYGK